MIVMWQVRLRMRVARPRARGRQRLSVGPSSAKHALTNSSSAAMLVVVLGVGHGRGEYLADRPRDVTVGELQHLDGAGDGQATDEVEDLAGLPGRRVDVAWPGPRPPRDDSLSFGPEGHQRRPLLLLAGVVPEGPGGRELAQLVTDHALGDVHRHVLAAVVDGDGVPDHVGDDRGAAASRS